MATRQIEPRREAIGTGRIEKGREREKERERESSGLMEQTHSIPSLLSEFTAISFQDNLLA